MSLIKKGGQQLTTLMANVWAERGSDSERNFIGKKNWELLSGERARAVITSSEGQTERHIDSSYTNNQFAQTHLCKLLLAVEYSRVTFILRHVTSFKVVI